MGMGREGRVVQPRSLFVLHKSVLLHIRSFLRGPPTIEVTLLSVSDSGIGKSCFLKRWAEDSFADDFPSTEVIDCTVRTQQHKLRALKYKFWDWRWQEPFDDCPITNGYRGAHGLFLAYDATKRASFDRVLHWHATIPHMRVMTSVLCCWG